MKVETILNYNTLKITIIKHSNGTMVDNLYFKVIKVHVFNTT